MSDSTDLKVEIERLKQENEDLKRSKKEIHYKVSVKGAVSVYGFGRFPVTLYKEQWERIFENADKIKAFIEEHESELKTKDS
jgi:hypothetical protein